MQDAAHDKEPKKSLSLKLRQALSFPAELLSSLAGVFFKVLAAEYLLALVAWYALSDGLKDLSGTPLGADFINVYAAGLSVHQGQPQTVYDGILHHQIEQATAGYAAPFVGWNYPPMFLFIASLFALEPYLLAFILYIATSLAGFWVVLRRIAPRSKEAFWALAAFPGIFANIINGQNGFITAALFGAGFLKIEKRPWLAGIFFGLLAYKPQFFIVIPLMLALGGYGRAFLSTGLTALASAALSWVAFGTTTWQAFFDGTGQTQHVLLEQGTVGWQKIQSVFSLSRMWGSDIVTAYALQSLVAAFALISTAYIWRSKTTMPTKAAALCCSLLLTTPYLLDYDLVILAVPIAFLAKQGMQTTFRAYEKPLLALLWLLPLLARNPYLPLTPPLLLGLMALCLSQARGQREQAEEHPTESQNEAG